MCHGQALQVTPLVVARCLGCGTTAQLFGVRFKRVGEFYQVKLCRGCVDEIVRKLR